MEKCEGLTRHLYRDGLRPGTATTAWADAWLEVLIIQDGSATLLSETIAHSSIRLDIVHQAVTDDVPDEVRRYLSGRTFLERQVCMSHNGEVMMDNLSFIALDSIDAELRTRLEEGIVPIGHIFSTRWIRKRPVENVPTVQNRLWERSGLPDPQAVRSYLLEMPETTCMLITETFRAGMRLGLPLSTS